MQTIILKNPKELTPYKNNARKHSKEQINKIIGSIQEFGFVNPILITKTDQIIAGHGRVTAAIKIGIDKIPTLCIDTLSETQIKAYIIADNKLAELAAWDDEILKMELSFLKEEDFDLDKIGFEDFKIEDEKEPGEKSKEFNSTFEVVVECSDESDQEAVYKLMTSKGYKCKILTL